MVTCVFAVCHSKTPSIYFLFSNFARAVFAIYSPEWVLALCFGYVDQFSVAADIADWYQESPVMMDQLFINANACAKFLVFVGQEVVTIGNRGEHAMLP